MKLFFTLLITFLTIANLLASIAPQRGIPPSREEISIPTEFVFPTNELDSLFAPPEHLKGKTFLLELAKDRFFATQRDDEKIYYGSLILESAEDCSLILCEMIKSMQRLGKMSQITHMLDHFIKCAAAEKNTKLLSFIACYYAYNLPRGIMVDTVFYVGANRTGRDKINGDLLYAQQRFRVLALRQLMYALNLCETDSQRWCVYDCMANVLTLHTDPQTGFKKKTDITQLPPLEAHYYTPDEKREALFFYEVPNDIFEAKNDGQWHRFCIAQMIKIDPKKGIEKWFEFVRARYNCDYDEFIGSDSEMEPLVQSLKTNEIFRFKTAHLNQFSGNNRFDIIQVPDDYNLILIASQLPKNALFYLGEILKERKTYAKAVHAYTCSLEKHEGKEALEYIQKHHYNVDKDHFKHEFLTAEELIKLCSNQQEIVSGATQKKGILSFDLIFRNTPEIKSEIFKLNTDSYLQLSEAFLKNVPLKNRQNHYLNHPKYPYREWNLNDLLLKADTELNLWGKKMGEFNSKLNPRHHFLLQEKISLNAQLPQGDYILKVSAPHGNIYYALFTVNDIQIEVKPFKDSLLFLVCDTQTGRGIPNAKIDLFAYQIYQFNANEIQRDHTRFEVRHKNISLQTNADGFILFQKEDNLMYNISGIITTQEGKKTIIAQSPLYNFMHQNRFSSNLPHMYRTFTVTNQNVYRPGQQVKIAGFYREIGLKADQQIDLFSSIDLSVSDRDHVTIFEKKIKTTPNGSYEAEFTLPYDAKLGNYTGKLNTKHFFGRFNFNVEAYRKGEYEVNILLDSAQKLGDSLVVTASALYYAGGKDFKGRATVKIETQDDSDLPKPLYGRWDYLYERPNNIFQPNKKTIFEEEKTVDAHGNIIIDIPTELNSVNPSLSRTYTVHVTWVNASNRIEKATQSIVLSPKPFTLESTLNQTYYNLGETVYLTCNIKRMQGYNAPLEHSVKVTRTDETGNVQTLEDKTLKDSKDFNFKPQKGGFYTFIYTTKNKDFLDCSHQICVVYERNCPIYSESPLKVFKKKQLSTIGEKAHLLVTSSIQNGFLYIFEKPKNALHQQLVIKPFTQGAIELEFDVTSDDTPNFFVELIAIGDHQKAQEIVNFLVPPEDQTLKIVIDAPKNKIPPNKEVTIPFTVKNDQNEGVSVPCIVTIYDVALDVFSAGLGADIYSVFLNKMYDFQYINLFELQQLNITFSPPSLEGFVKHLSPPPYLLYNTYDYFLYGNQGSFNVIPLFPGFDSYHCDQEKIGISYNGRFMMPRDASAMNANLHDKQFSFQRAAESVADAKAMYQNKSAPIVRTKFSDAPYFNACILTDHSGRGEIKFKTPDNLGRFWIKIWAASTHTKVGYQADSIVIGKELMLRIQTPRFLVQGDSILMTANVQNESKTEQIVLVKLTLDGKELVCNSSPQMLTIAPAREAEANFSLEAKHVGKGVLTLSAITQGEGEDDAMRVDFPIISREIEKIIRQSTAIVNGKNSCEFELTLPKERVDDTTHIQIEISPSLDAALIEALPYLVGYPHHCVEQTLNRFLPAAYLNQTLHDLGIAPDTVMRGVRPVHQKTIMGFDENNNPILSDNPVYSDTFVRDATRVGLNRIFNMQQGDGWGWFPGGNIDYYMTSLIFEGLLELNGSHILVDDQMFERSKRCLQNYQTQRVEKRLLPIDNKAHLSSFSNLDMRIAYLLEKVEASDSRMIEFLLKDYPKCSIQSVCYLGLMMHQFNRPDKAAELQSYIEQYLRINQETQTAYLNLPNAHDFWYWYGDDMVTHAVYLRLLLIIDPHSEKCAFLVNHMVNNRKNSCAWNSTLSTSMCVRALSDYLRKTYKKTNAQNIKIFVNNTPLTDSIFKWTNDTNLLKIRVERERTNGPLFVQATASFNTQEKMIAASGHEIKVQRYYFLRRYETVAIKRPNYAGIMKTHFVRLSSRTPLKEGDTVSAGDEVEVQLIVTANNHYEYLLLTDPRGAGFETVHSQSGYISRPLWHFAEYRDLAVNFYINKLSQGRHIFTYTLRAEKAGSFSVLPTTIEPMYLPKLKANSAEQQFKINQPN